MLAFTAIRAPLSSFLVLKVRVLPLGNGTFTTGRTVGILVLSWQVEHRKPSAGGWPTTPVTSSTGLGSHNTLPALAMNWGRPVALWHLAQPAGTRPASSQSRNGMPEPAK